MALLRSRHLERDGSGTGFRNPSNRLSYDPRHPTRQGRCDLPIIFANLSSPSLGTNLFETNLFFVLHFKNKKSKIVPHTHTNNNFFKRFFVHQECDIDSPHPTFHQLTGFPPGWGSALFARKSAIFQGSEGHQELPSEKTFCRVFWWPKKSGKPCRLRR